MLTKKRNFDKKKNEIVTNFGKNWSKIEKFKKLSLTQTLEFELRPNIFARHQYVRDQLRFRPFEKRRLLIGNFGEEFHFEPFFQKEPIRSLKAHFQFEVYFGREPKNRLRFRTFLKL